MMDFIPKRSAPGGTGPYISYGQQQTKELGKAVGIAIRENAAYHRRENQYKTIREWQEERAGQV